MRQIISLFPLIVVCIFCFTSCSNSSAKEEPEKDKLPTREPVVNGAFYPSEKNTLTKMVDKFLSSVNKKPIAKNKKLFALIAPHAGYVYSGQVAAYAFKQIENMKIDTVILIGPSHHVFFNGISVYPKGYYKSPLGLVEIDSKLTKQLINSGDKIYFNPDAHAKEHALEVELPFLQRALKHPFKIVPIIMGNQSQQYCQILHDALLPIVKKENVLIVVSADLSHYHPYTEAIKLDNVALSAISDLDTAGFAQKVDSGKIEIDAPGVIYTVMTMAKELGAANPQIIKYANSGDVTNDKSRVVGYSACMITIPQKTPDNIRSLKAYPFEGLSQEDKKSLIKIARDSIEEYVRNGRIPKININSSALKRKCGAFVTLNKNSRLRGCIGYIYGIKPLYQTVQETAISAATKDPRFPAVTADELDDIEIEISALSPLKRVKHIEDIIVGKHGIYIVKGMYSGLLLPQVATDYGWDRETFLQQTCQKAGLPFNAWKDKDTDIYIFSADIFHE